MKPHNAIPIRDNGDPLAPLPQEAFGFTTPHPYQAAGAPYGKASPWHLRQPVLDKLLRAQARLARAGRLGWRFLLFDAWRPNAVQDYMVERAFCLHAAEMGVGKGLDWKNRFDLERRHPEVYAPLAALVFRVWGIPSDDPATPPLHSTGATVDLTLMDTEGREADMGSPIDESSDRSLPDYFANATDPAGRAAHANRCLLRDVLAAEGFTQHLLEWWHFSWGDQYWAWRQRETGADPDAIAHYGRVEPPV